MINLLFLQKQSDEHFSKKQNDDRFQHTDIR